MLLLALMVGSLAACDATPIPDPSGGGTGGTNGGSMGGNGAGPEGTACGFAPGTGGNSTAGATGTSHVPVPQSCAASGLVASGGTGGSLDHCLSDTDCAPKAWCNCGQDVTSAFYQGPNLCAGGQCRVDSDCASGLCSPSPGSGCGPTTTGRFCRTSHDTCRSDSDCGSCAHPDSPRPDTCQYVREAGHWQCATAYFCGG